MRNFIIPSSEQLRHIDQLTFQFDLQITTISKKMKFGIERILKSAYEQKNTNDLPVFEINGIASLEAIPSTINLIADLL